MIAFPLGFQEDILFRCTFSMAMKTRAAKVCKRLTDRSEIKLATLRASVMLPTKSRGQFTHYCLLYGSAAEV